MNDKSALNQIMTKVKSVSNILVTVSRNPSVDQLAAALATALLLDKMGKHATAVYSGDTPSVINFLDPEKTFENNADSLRDFIISLDKQKADRLRFKVEGDVAKVLITPYRTTISEADLSFSDGEFNVEFVIAIGVDKKDDLDAAIAAHGRIFHDATVATLNLQTAEGSLGSISWHDALASSYCEMVSRLAEGLETADKPLLDEQIATAILTGIVDSTDQFRNEKTSSAVMTLAANLMAKGANQQLISSELAMASRDAEPQQDNVSVDNIALSTGANQSQSGAELLLDRAKDASQEIPSETPEKQNAPDEVNLDSTVKVESDRFAKQDSADALAAARAQLTEVQSDIDEGVASIDAPTQSPEAQLDSVVAASNSSAILDDLKNEAINVAQELSHTTPYVMDNADSPLNGAIAEADIKAPEPLESHESDRVLQPIQGGPMIAPSVKLPTPAPATNMAPSLAAGAAIQPPESSDNSSAGLPPLPTPSFDLPSPPALPLPPVGVMPPSSTDITPPAATVPSLDSLPDLTESLVETPQPTQNPSELFPTVNTSSTDPTQYRIPGE